MSSFCSAGEVMLWHGQSVSREALSVTIRGVAVSGYWASSASCCFVVQRRWCGAGLGTTPVRAARRNGRGHAGRGRRESGGSPRSWRGMDYEDHVSCRKEATVLACRAFDRLDDGVLDRRASCPVRIGPLLGHQALVPAQDRVWRDQPMSAQQAGSTGGSVKRSMSRELLLVFGRLLVR